MDYFTGWENPVGKTPAGLCNSQELEEQEQRVVGRDSHQCPPKGHKETADLVQNGKLS